MLASVAGAGFHGGIGGGNDYRMEGYVLGDVDVAGREERAEKTNRTLMVKYNIPAPIDNFPRIGMGFGYLL